MRLLWLADVLRAAGLVVHEYPGWKTRGAERTAPVEGIMCHHTGSSPKSTDADDLRQLALTGTPSAPDVPISELMISRSAAWWVIASGVATGVKTGTGGPLKGKGDKAVVQIEAQHAGASEPWTREQYESYVRGCAAIAAHLGIDVRFVIGHKEHQPGDKNDPSFDMNVFRANVAAVLNGEDMDLDYGKWPAPAVAGDRSAKLMLAETWNAEMNGQGAYGGKTLRQQQLDRIEAAGIADREANKLMLAAIQALATAGGVDAAPIVNAINAAKAELAGKLGQMGTDLAAAVARADAAERRVHQLLAEAHQAAATTL